MRNSVQPGKAASPASPTGVVSSPPLGCRAVYRLSTRSFGQGPAAWPAGKDEGVMDQQRCEMLHSVIISSSSPNVDILGTQGLCEKGGGPGLSLRIPFFPLIISHNGFCGRKTPCNSVSCVKVEVAFLGSPSLINLMASVDVR